MSDYLKEVGPAPPYTDTRSNIVASKETTARIPQNGVHAKSLENCETNKLRFSLKEHIDHCKHPQTDWGPHSVDSVSFNTFDNSTLTSVSNSFNLINSTLNICPVRMQNSENSINRASNNTDTGQNSTSKLTSPNNLIINNLEFLNSPQVQKHLLKNDTGVISLNSTNVEVNEVAQIERNEFSDHSDSESFTRLSESVFEAIEDTQDSIINNHDTNEEQTCQLTKESKKSKHKPRTCHICGKVYNASSSYFYHMKHFHRRTKEHSCDVCNKKFGTRGDLIQHSAVHTIECKFECRSCDKKFRSRASRYIHEQIHDGVKSYKCANCEKCFRWRTHLQRHMLRHAATKQHECRVCGRGFAVRCDLLRHARTHNVGNYLCDKCDVKFAQVRYLKAHMAKKHNITAKDTG